MTDCIFCKIAEKEVLAEIVYEDDDILGFKNNQPEAPIHLLFIPKRHIEWKDEFDKDDLALLSGLIAAAKKIAIEKNIFLACKLIFNIGKTGHIAHIHIHLLGGWEKEVPMRNV
jgi:histidine triad (HIT) family protein